ncbi:MULTISPECIES: hypothetical protein [unclassified Microbacterium]|uniref:hypothetical protein n=1 Tax=unclassified Microbacterium TaxID=2609290 RepID=UPI000EA9A827|nr:MULTISPECIES: hypothetical protein [unclassified Microbacterium]MBT2485064.1 hypothetical protein [Microbacterium sp. ISL-108]RKN67911.1 hypothetical protein D7252_10120 [Microbacterium sp. CGR2]
MLNADELEELRALHARAYGRDGGLTDAEAARLRELDVRRRAVDDAPAKAAQREESTAPDAPSRSWQDPKVFVAPLGVPAEPHEPESSASAPASATSFLSLVRSHWRPVALAAAVLVVGGIGLGGALFGKPAEPALELTPEQQKWHEAIVAGGDYDSGSVRAAAVEGDVVVWTATKDERKRTCLIFSDGDQARPNCQLTDAVMSEGIWGSIVVEANSEIRREVQAQVLFTASGQPAVAVSSYEHDSGSTGMTYANANETRIAEKLVGEGFDPPSIWVIGYDDAVPIWTATMSESREQCLIYDGATDPIELSCSDTESLQADTPLLGLSRIDASGATTRYEMQAGNGPSFLVITREGGEVGAAGD